MVTGNDLTNDGTDDVVLENTATGDRVIWAMGGGIVSFAVSLGNLPTVWRLGGVSDIDGDGEDDIFYDNTSTGARVAWLMNGVAVVISAPTLTVESTVWRTGGILNPAKTASVASVEVTPGGTSIVSVSGGTVNFSAVARDALGNPLAETITWSVSNPVIGRITSGGVFTATGSGSVTVTATADGVPGTATVSVTAAAGAFTITMQNITMLSESVQNAFTDAAARWAEIIRGDLGDFNAVGLDVGFCTNDAVLTHTGVIDDILIYVTVGPIDGVGSILGSAGWCYRRGGSTGLPLVGQMLFDEADLADLETDGLLSPVILHEMGHVLGIGTSWNDPFSLLQDPAPSAGAQFDPIFVGANAQWIFPSLATGYTGRHVPVENLFGDGTRNAHWRESIVARELMTGFLTGGVGAINPLSPLTINSLRDMGYVTDASEADVQPWFLRLAPTYQPAVRIQVREILQPVPGRVIGQ
jgi:hypothetical protein